MTISGRTPSQKNNSRLNSNAIATSSIVGLHIHQFQNLNTSHTINDLLWVVHFTYVYHCSFRKMANRITVHFWTPGIRCIIIHISTSGTIIYIYIYIYIYTGCNRRNGPDFGRVFLMLYCTDITQNTYIQS